MQKGLGMLLEGARGERGLAATLGAWGEGPVAAEATPLMQRLQRGGFSAPPSAQVSLWANTGSRGVSLGGEVTRHGFSARWRRVKGSCL